MHVHWCPDSRPISDGDMWALQLTSERFYLKNGRWRYKSEGLIVAAVQGRPRYYRRIGQYYASVYYNMQKEDFGTEDSCSDNSDEDDLNTEESDQDEYVNDETYTTELDPGDLATDDQVADERVTQGSVEDNSDTDDSDTDRPTAYDLPCPWNREKKVIYLI